MKKNQITKNKTIILYLIGSLILTLIGVFIIPLFLQKISSKIYKKALKDEEINIEEQEPEIVKKK